MPMLWLKLIKGATILRQTTLSFSAEELYEKDAVLGVLDQGVHLFDLSMPVVLPSHHSDWIQYHRAIFYAGDFVEEVSFDRMEAILFSDKAKR